MVAVLIVNWARIVKRKNTRVWSKTFGIGIITFTRRVNNNSLKVCSQNSQISHIFARKIIRFHKLDPKMKKYLTMCS